MYLSSPKAPCGNGQNVRRKFMRHTIILILILFGSEAIAQIKVPQLNFQSDQELDSQSVYKCLISEFNEIAGFTYECYWGTNQTIYILGKKTSKWKTYKVKITYNENWPKSLDNIKRMSIRRVIGKQSKIEAFIKYLTSNNLLSISSDSLNIFSKENKFTIPMTDGCSEYFQFWTKNQFKSISCYEPDYYQNEVSTRDREIFINTRNEYLRLFARE